MNPVLARQLRRLGLDPDSPPDAAGWKALLARVSRSYDDSDRSRYLIERSLLLSSQEMRELHERMQQMTQAQLERSESHYRNIFAQAPIAMWEEDFTEVGTFFDDLRAAGVIDLQRYFDDHPEEMRRAIRMIRIIDVNAAAVVLMRTPEKSSLLGPMDPDLVFDDGGGDPYHSFRTEFQAIWDNVSRVTFEFTGSRADGTELYGIFNLSMPSVNGRLDLSRAVVAIVDITDRKQAERRMRELIKSKDEFLASVSHELRTPLTTVYASAESLIDDTQDFDAELREELIGYIAREAGELSDMVEDLLVAARADIGTVSCVPRQTDLVPIVERVLTSARADRLELDIHDDEVCGSAWADPLRLTQIVRNLVSNAVRYGGPSIRVQAETVGAETYLTVMDNGEGVPEERRASIFALYERGHDESAPVGSVGVGLAVARQLAELMGGTLEYDYAGGWSRFRLALPAVAPSASPPDSGRMDDAGMAALDAWDHGSRAGRV